MSLVKKPFLVHIVATLPDGLIGVGNDLPWKFFRPDMMFFKNTTMNHVVVMGYNTVLSLPSKLDNRFVVGLVNADRNSSDKFNQIADRPLSDTCLFLDEMSIPEGYNKDVIFIAGGKNIYRRTINDVDIVLRNVLIDVELKKPIDGSERLYYYPIEDLMENFTLVTSEKVSNSEVGGPYMEKQVWVKKK